MEKTCSICHLVKELSQFHSSSITKDGHVNHCKSCQKDRDRKHYLNNPTLKLDKIKAWRKNNQKKQNAINKAWRDKNPINRANHWMKSRYGITQEQKDHMRTQQDNRCAICNNIFLDSKSIHLDHNHTTGQIRSLLCRHCNAMLGHARESEVTLRAAIEYIIKWRDRTWTA